VDIIFSENIEAQEIMDKDMEILSSLEKEPILHLYDWPGPTITYGHFIKIKKYLNLKEVEQRNIHLAKRPTGGGIVFHLGDLSFSFFLPSSHRAYSRQPLDNYQFVNQKILSVLDSLIENTALLSLTFEDKKVVNNDCSSFCMARPTKYDVFFQGKKVGGAAQRNKKQGYLHQGMIKIVDRDQDLVEKLLLKDNEIYQAMQLNSCSLLGLKLDQERDFRANLKEKLIDFFSEL
jgi:lipoate---protein ligase